MYPQLSVVICTHNRPEKLHRAVSSVLANSFREFELIVVDQSTDGLTRARLATIDDPRLRYYTTNTVGVAISRNMAIRAARADIVAFTDDDCICDRDWLAAIRGEFDADPDAVGVYGRAVPCGDRGSSDRDCISHSGDLVCPAMIQATERRVIERPAIPHLVVGGGNNMSFRKEAFRRVGLFIETLGPGSRIGTGEDTEFTYRLLYNHCRLVYSPRPVIEHDNWLSRDAFAHQMKVAMRVQAAILSSYALRFDSLAASHLLRTAWYLTRNTRGIGSALAGLTAFASGLPHAPGLRLYRPSALGEPLTTAG